MNQETYAIYYRSLDAFGTPYYTLYTSGIKTPEQGKRKVIQFMRGRGVDQTVSYLLFKEIKTLEPVEVDLDEVLPVAQGLAMPAPINDWNEDDEGDW